MPTTINGIGTHYYGKKNRSTRQGTCRSCNRTGNLESYDTRLYFVIVFIPVIPLGRKRIMDQCPHCQRHFVANQDQYQMQRQLSLSGAREQFRNEPSPETAIAVHAQMLGFHAIEDAQTFRQEALELFPDDALLHAVLAMQLDEVNEYDLATPLYQRAYELRPELPEVRDGLALRRIVEGKLDEARELIRFLEEPGAGQTYPLTRLQQLAEAYQRAGRHQEVIELSERLLQHAPQAGQHREFRKFVQKSEQALQRSASVLPPNDSTWLGLFNPRNNQYSSGQRWAAYLALVGVLVVVGMVVLNEYRRRHRQVIVRNEFSPHAEVRIDGGTVVPAGVQTNVVLPEGRHHVVVSGKIQEEFDIDVQTGYWQRWTHKPVWVINVGGASPLMLETLYYAVNPRPADSNFLAGERIVFAPHIDYLFETAPDSLQVDNSSKQVTKQRLSLAEASNSDMFLYLMSNSPGKKAWTFAESRLLLYPEDDELLSSYAGSVMNGPDRERGKNFLKSQLDRRPVAINWHRMYQEIHPSAAEHRELAKVYDAMLTREPENGALLYLRGRLSATKQESQEYFERAIAADNQLSWPWAALGYSAFTRGDWQKCKEYLAEAHQRGHSDDTASILFVARLGLGEADQLAAEYRQQMLEGPPENKFANAIRLCGVLATQGDDAAARQVLVDWEAANPAETGYAQVLEIYRGLLDYMLGDMAAVEQRVANDAASPELEALWLLVTGQPDKAAQDEGLAETWKKPWMALALSVAFDLAGDDQQAATWREAACVELDKLDFDEVYAAERLRAADPPTEAQLAEVGLTPPEHSLFLAALALRFPEQHAQLAAAAQHFAVQAGSYTPLVRQVSAKVP